MLSVKTPHFGCYDTLHLKGSLGNCGDKLRICTICLAMRSILVKILASESVACLAGVRKGTGSEFGRDVPEIPSPSLPLQTPPTQATESIFSVSSGSTMNLHQLERFPFELEMITDEKNTHKLTTIQEFDWVNLPHRRFRTW